MAIKCRLVDLIMLVVAISAFLSNSSIASITTEDIEVPASCESISKATDHLLFSYSVTFPNGTTGPSLSENEQPFHMLLEQGADGNLHSALKGMCENATRRLIVDDPGKTDLAPMFNKGARGIEDYLASMNDAMNVDVKLRKVTSQENYRIFDALKQENYSLVLDLIDNHVGINSMDEWGQTPLMIAVSQQLLPVVSALLNTRLPKVDVNLSKFSGFNAVFYAVEKATPGILQALLRRGADPNAIVKQDGGRGNTPLHYACMLEKVKHAALLLEFGAHPDASNEHGQQPLQLVPRDAVRSTKLMYKQMFEEVWKKSLEDGVKTEL